MDLNAQDGKKMWTWFVGGKKNVEGKACVFVEQISSGVFNR
jgi:hypothetical protein